MADIEGSNGQRTEFKAVGRANVPGRLSYTIATGGAKFGTDVVVPNMLHAKFLRSPHGRAKIKSMDISKAKALEGVVDIVTWDDPEIQSMNAAMTNAEVKPMAGIRGSMIPNEAETEDEEIGAVVVAVTPEICDEALKLIKVEWDVLPSIVDALDGLKPGAPIIRARSQRAWHRISPQGDVEAGFKEADHIVEFDWAHSRTASHIPNPNGSVAWWAQDPWGVEGPTLYIEGISSYVGRISAAPHVQCHLRQAPSQHPVPGGQILRLDHPPLPAHYAFAGQENGEACPMRKRKAKRLLSCKSAAIFSRKNRIQKGWNDYGGRGEYHRGSGSSGRNGFRMGGFEARFSPFNTTRCVNQKSHFQAVFTNSGRNTLSQTSPFNWDSMTIAEQIVADSTTITVAGSPKALASLHRFFCCPCVSQSLMQSLNSHFKAHLQNRLLLQGL